MKDFILYLVQNIVQNPTSVQIEEDIIEQYGRPTKIYTIRTHQDDIKLIIGKRGATINSLRNICKLKAFKAKEFIDLKVADSY